MEDLRSLFQISEEEEILINEVIEEISKDHNVVSLIINNMNNVLFLSNYKYTLQERIKNYYIDHNREEKLLEAVYINPGGIIEYMVQSIIRLCEAKAA